MEVSIRNSDDLPWDSRQLTALLAVVETGTFTGAADELGYTQSAVSQQVAALERAVGAPLFDRPGGPRRVRLTPLGEVFVGHARAIVARVQAAQADVAAVLSGDRGALRVAILQSVGTKVLPRLLRRYREERPGVDLMPSETVDLHSMAEGVESGEFDLAFTQLPMPDGPFAVRRVLDDPYVLLTPADAPEVGAASITLRAVARLPLIGFSDPELDEELLNHLRRTGREPEFVFHTNDNPTIHGFVAEGLGYALMPRLTVDEDDPMVGIVPVVTGMPARSLAIVWHADRQLPESVTRFVDLAAEICDELSEEWATS